MKRKVIIVTVLIALGLVAYFIYNQSAKPNTNLFCQVSRGDMEVIVYTSGQLESENSKNILIPEGLKNRDLRIYEIKITDLIEEGTSVDSGDYVGALDRTQVEEKISNAKDEIQNLTEAFEDAQMDSVLNVSNAQDAIIDAESDVEERKMVLKESTYESPAIIRKTQMDLERAERQLQQAKNSLSMKTKQEAATLKRKSIELAQKNKVLNDLQEVLKDLTIRAPMKGMLIYAKNNQGEVIQVGSNVNLWSPIIATLPDMNQLISRTYVNEIDISKIAKKQKVNISVDAFPSKRLKGEVISVANIGQTQSKSTAKSTAKVFEVVVRVSGTDPELKPGMTTSNRINTGLLKDTLMIPLDAVYKEDSSTYVYLYQGGNLNKQSVQLGLENENYVVVEAGLKEGDKLQMNEPEEPIEGKMDKAKESQTNSPIK